MLTEFGKFSRKLRIDKGELLKDMAEVLSVTPSYLSAVEIGKRNVPDDWKAKLVKYYELDETEEKMLTEAICNSQLNLKISFNGVPAKDKELMFSFARNFNELNSEDKDSIRKILNKISK